MSAPQTVRAADLVPGMHVLAPVLWDGRTDHIEAVATEYSTPATWDASAVLCWLLYFGERRTYVILDADQALQVIR